MAHSINYTVIYFKYPVLTPVNGELINKSVKRLKMELRENGSRVDAYQGGVDHGYLGLPLDDAEYARIISKP